VNSHTFCYFQLTCWFVLKYPVCILLPCANRHDQEFFEQQTDLLSGGHGGGPDPSGAAKVIGESGKKEEKKFWVLVLGILTEKLC